MSIPRPTRRRADVARRRGWWSGLAVNLALSLLYLLVAPLTAVPHRDWAVLVGTYFATFLLADTATTNALGGDAGRVGRRLDAGASLGRILLTKNVTLLLAVGLPALAATALITVEQESASRLLLTVPAVLGPVLAWLGLGNVASVVLAVPAVPLRQRWQQRGDLACTARWVVVVALPYVLCAVVDPLAQLPTLAFRLLGVGQTTSPVVPAAVLLVTGLVTYAGLTAGALHLVRRRPLVLHRGPAVPSLALAA